MGSKILSVRTKLTLSFAIIVTLVIVASGVALTGLGAANQRFQDYLNGINARADMTMQVRTAVDRRAIAARNLVLVTAPSDISLETRDEVQAEADVKTSLEKLVQMAAGTDVSQQTKALVENIVNVEARYRLVTAAIVQAVQGGKHDEAIRLLVQECRPLLRQLVEVTDRFAQYTRSQQVEIVAEANQAFAFQRTLLIAFCLLAIVFALLAGYFITRNLMRTLGAEPVRLNDAVARVAAGDLTEVAGAVMAPATSTLAAIANMQGKLAHLVGEVHEAAANIASGSSQAAAGNQDLASRTTQQAAALEETAASMAQISATVAQNADNAQQVSTLANDASEKLVRSSEAVTKVAATMEDINSSSAKITQIIKVIEGIAFQTNILALNAAVEAARAGEQGRGFAVVASEVRSLAQRSSASAKEISELISDSVQEVATGTEQAANAKDSMAQVTQAVAQVATIIGEIAHASDEQRTGIGQINEAITQMSVVTQRNSALVEETAAAAKLLSDQGAGLKRVVGFFQTTTDQTQTLLTSASTPAINVTRYPLIQRQAELQEESWQPI